MLKDYVKLYVPSTRNINIPLSIDESKILVSQYASKLSHKFGGCTGTIGQGYYDASDGTQVIENVTILQSYYDTDKILAWDFIKSLALQLKVELTQESVTIESNDGIEFI